MNRIDETFRRLREAGRKAFIPFLTAGDPDLETTAALVRECEARGASVIELGIPYSDPIADGATIQASYARALSRGVTIDAILAMVRSIRGEVTAPIIAMISVSLVYRRGLSAFIAAAQSAGVDGAIIPDLPVDDLPDTRSADFPLVLLSAPTTPERRRRMIAERSRGFIYCVSVTGITGARDDLPPDVIDHVKALKALTETPVCVGFGVSRPDQVNRLCQVADGVIVGSAIVRLVEANGSAPRDQLVKAVGDFVAGLAAAAG